MLTLLLMNALALAQTEAPEEELADTFFPERHDFLEHEEVHPPPPPLGLADLHLHQWAELAYASRWYHGSADGPAVTALAQCGEVSNDFQKAPRPTRVNHGVLVRGVPFSRSLAAVGMQDERSDDVRPRHAPGGVSTLESLPHWLGWPTNNTISHQQIWEGWLRLAHDGVPFLWFLGQHTDKVNTTLTDPNAEDSDGDGLGDGDEATLQDALFAFYEDYPANMQAAAAEGAVGLNLAVVSLVHNNLMCRQQVSGRSRQQDPAICADMDVIKRQYDAVLSWAGENREWVSVAAGPFEAQRAIQEGKLALLLSIEASDVFGPSETIGAGRFKLGYSGRAREILASDANVRTRKEAVKRALREYLEQLPLVSTLQLTHQYDSAFAGAAFISNTFVRQQAWRDRRPRPPEPSQTVARVAPDPPDNEAAPNAPLALEDLDDVRPPHSCAEAARQWKAWTFGAAPTTGEEPFLYPDCLAQLTREVLGKPGASALLRVVQNTPPKHLIPAKLAARSEVRPYQNPFGLSEDGRSLVEVLQERGMMLDTSHMSRNALRDLEAMHGEQADAAFFLDRRYSSHSYPMTANLLRREQNALDEELAGLSIVGVRPGDDEVSLDTGDDALDANPFAEVLAEHDCYGTSVASGHYLHAASAGMKRRTVNGKEPDFGVTYGSDLNGFVNQPAGTATLRPPSWKDHLCTTAVPSIGSEVAHRGLAHVGLLPQLHMEMVATSERSAETPPGEGIADEVLSEPLVGAWRYLESWKAIACQTVLPPEGCSTDVVSEPQSPEPVVPWRGWREWVRDGEGQLRTIAVEVAVPSAVAEAPRSAEPPKAEAAPPPEPPGGPDQRVTIELPYWRAIEAVLPYYHRPVGPEPMPQAGYSQLPTRLGFMIGAFSLEASWKRRHFPYGRCVSSGWSNLALRGDMRRQREHCAELKRARKQYRRARRRRDETNVMLAAWDRVYAGPLAGDRSDALQTRLTEVLDAATSKERSAWFDFVPFEPTAKFFAKDARECLEADGILDAPPVGLLAGASPREWVDKANRFVREIESEDDVYSDGADPRAARDCYCRLLREADDKNWSVPRDREALDACPPGSGSGTEPPR